MKTTTIDEAGSFITDGKKWSVLQCRGSVRNRQRLASQKHVICYAEAHLNSVPDQKVQHGFVITGENIPKATERWAESFLGKVADSFDVDTHGIMKGAQGSGCVQYVTWPTPTMLLEPLFLSHPETAELLTTGEGIDMLGRCLAESIMETFPDGGLVGLSIGHAYRGTGDKGAKLPADLNGDGIPDWEWDTSLDEEAELCEAYVKAATEILILAE